MKSRDVIIKQGKKEDIPKVFDLIMELAEYEKGADQVTNSIEAMERDGFGDDPSYGFYVAVCQDKIVGMALYYMRYSTWKGRRLYLEDIIVTKKERGKEIGTQLFYQLLKLAHSKKCGLVWQVLAWNRSAISFYERFGSNINNEWLNCSLELDQIQKTLS